MQDSTYTTYLHSQYFSTDSRVGDSRLPPEFEASNERQRFSDIFVRGTRNFFISIFYSFNWLIWKRDKAP